MEEKWMDMLEEKESERALFGDDLCAWRRGVDVMCWRSGTVVWAVDEEREGSLRDLWSGGERRWRDGGGQREERAEQERFAKSKKKRHERKSV